jgi:uncharacterized protein (TIGR02246 family)
MSAEQEVTSLYVQLIAGWNEKSGAGFAAPFAEDAAMIGYDGSEQSGRDQIAHEMQAIFEGHEVASYVAKVRSVEMLSADAAILHAVVGMIPPGESDLNPDRNAHQTVVATRRDGDWRIAFFQNTPAQFHGRPDLAEALTDELRRAAG